MCFRGQSTNSPSLQLALCEIVIRPQKPQSDPENHKTHSTNQLLARPMQPHKQTRLTDSQTPPHRARRLILQDPKLHHIAQALGHPCNARQGVAQQFALTGNLFGVGRFTSLQLKVTAVAVVRSGIKTVKPCPLANHVHHFIFQDGGEPAARRGPRRGHGPTKPPRTCRAPRLRSGPGRAACGTPNAAGGRDQVQTIRRY